MLKKIGGGNLAMGVFKCRYPFDFEASSAVYLDSTAGKQYEMDCPLDMMQRQQMKMRMKHML